MRHARRASVSGTLPQAPAWDGRPALAAAALDELAPHAHQAWARAALGRARGLAAAQDAFHPPLQRSVATFAELGARLEEARSPLCHGERVRRAGRRVHARAQLRATLALLERMRCEPRAERAESELRASGETLRTRGPGSAVDELTPQEYRSRRWPRAGLSNKEAAARLFLSVKTIEAHLHRTYRKLGVRSRAELRATPRRAGPERFQRQRPCLAAQSLGRERSRRHSECRDRRKSL